ncbi:hypothetical protein Catovirus_1_861 [Catovirus CTV1]|uniref:Uncharacterized protein n=1 Tax=Catovirus CTV1 TaxID=1977631 RepID=A0A1V0SAU9_9VIRU|nr:hypothetical protein Catovirus_1_861 [Catovirus CTV1]
MSLLLHNLRSFVVFNHISPGLYECISKEIKSRTKKIKKLRKNIIKLVEYTKRLEETIDSLQNPDQMF